MSSLGYTYFDIIAVVLILIFVIAGLASGFFKQVVSVISIFASVVLSKLFTGMLLPTLPIESLLHSKIESSVSCILETSNAKDVINPMALYTEVLEKFGFLSDLVPNFITPDKLKPFETLNVTTKAKVIDMLVKVLLPVVQYVVSALVFLVLFIVLLIICKFIFSQIVSVLDKLPLIGLPNHVLGAVVGGLKGVCFVVIFAYVSFLLLSVFGDIGGCTMQHLLESKVYNIINEYKDIVIK